MADISIIHEGNTDYNVKDAVGREALAVVENKGAKNILKTYDIPETTSGNVVFSIIDGVCSVSTTATQTTARVLVYAMDTDVGNTSVDSRYTIPRGTYILKTTGNGKVKLRAIEHDGTNTNQLAETTGADAEFTYSGTMPYVVFTLSVSSNTSLSETVTFIPMCCLKAEYIIDQTAVKYAKTNAELTNDTSTLFTENTRQETEIGVVANAGAKNVLPITNTTSEVSGITFTVNADNTVTSSGTLTSGVTSAVFECSNFQLPAGTYTYTCKGAAQQSVRDSYVQKYNGSSWDAVARDYENNTFTLTQTEQIRVRLRVYASGASGTFSPMIRPAAITDATFQPYAKTNRELTVLTDEDREALVELVDGGAKNLLKFESLSQDHRNGVDYTLNSDGSVTVNGTPSGTSESYVALTIGTATAYDASEFCDGNHIISGCPSGGGSSSYRIQVAKSNYVVYDYGSGAVLTPTTLTGVAILIYIPNGVTANNLVFRPMICTTSAWKISKTFQPYRPSYQELYERIVALENQNT